MINYDIRFVEFDDCFCNYSYIWLQDKELCDLINTTPPTKMQQKEWYKTLKNRNDYKIFGLKCDNIPIGVCGLKHITKNDGEYFGYIGVKNLWGKGIGQHMLLFIETIARSEKLNFIYLYVKPENSRAIKLYEKFEYIIDVEEDGLVKMQKHI